MQIGGKYSPPILSKNGYKIFARHCVDELCVNLEVFKWRVFGNGFVTFYDIVFHGTTKLPQGVIPAFAGIHNVKLTLKCLDPWSS